MSLLALFGLGFGVYLYLGGFFRPGFEVTGEFERAGQLLRSGSDVKLRGVLVGEVTRIRVTDEGTARVAMRIFPDQDIPANVNAAIRAKTLFGEKLVELRIPEDPQGRLGPGDRIPLDRTTGPFEVETILEKAVPLLGAIDPEMLGAAFRALAEGFVGNEEALRRATVQGATALSETERTLPNLENNLGHLRDLAVTLDDADDDLLRAMEGLTTAGQALNRSSDELRTTLEALAGITRDFGDIVVEREQDLSDLAGQGRAVLELVAEYAPELPDILATLDSFLGVWILDLSEGPWWRITLTQGFADDPPYAPGEEPRPRTADAAALRDRALRELAGDPDAPPPALTDILLAPVPDGTLDELLENLGIGRRERPGVGLP